MNKTTVAMMICPLMKPAYNTSWGLRSRGREKSRFMGNEKDGRGILGLQNHFGVLEISSSTGGKKSNVTIDTDFLLPFKNQVK